MLSFTHVSLFFFSFFFFFSFDGRVVAKLPFVPLSYIQGLSHRNLLGEDYTDCSFIFLYILCTMSIRQVTSTVYYQQLQALSGVNAFCCLSLDTCGFHRLCCIWHLYHMKRGQKSISGFHLSEIVISFFLPSPEHPEDARSCALQSCNQTGWRIPRTSSPGS